MGNGMSIIITPLLIVLIILLVKKVGNLFSEKGSGHFSEIGLFNEKSERWIRIYKALTVALFLFWVIFGVIAGLGDASGEFLDVDLGGESEFGSFVLWVIICCASGIFQLVFNMLVIQFLNNVQIIREKIEEM